MRFFRICIIDRGGWKQKYLYTQPFNILPLSKKNSPRRPLLFLFGFDRCRPSGASTILSKLSRCG